MVVRIYKGMHRSLFRDVTAAYVGTGAAQLLDTNGNPLIGEAVTISIIEADTSITSTTRIEGAA